MQQITVFIENSTGSITRVLSLLKKEAIQIYAISIADTAEYGLCRILCDNTAKAYEALKREGFATSTSEMVTVKMTDHPGGAEEILSRLSDAGINIAYFYSFHYDGGQALAFRTDETEKVAAIISKNNLSEII